MKLLAFGANPLRNQYRNNNPVLINIFIMLIYTSYRWDRPLIVGFGYDIAKEAVTVFSKYCKF